MRRHWTLAVFLLALSVLACNAPLPRSADVPPTDTPGVTQSPVTEAPPTEPAPTESPVPEEPPPTESPVAEAPTPTFTPPATIPSITPMVACTPPACKENEVYYCPGECPGGCGTQCATPTAGPLSPPTILSFTVDPAEIGQGESVSLSWQAVGGTEAHICWVTREAILACAPGPLNPDGGTQTVAPTAPGRPGVADMTLTVSNRAGSVEAHASVTIPCAEDPLPELADQGFYGNCPYGTVVGAAAYQPFSGGYMIWLDGTRMVYALYANGRYESYPDDFREGDPESDPTIVPPDGLYQPVRGFGLVWRSNQQVRDGLGWGLAPEMAFQGWGQSYSVSGMHNSGTFIRFVDGSIILLSHFGSTWRFVDLE